MKYQILFSRKTKKGGKYFQVKSKVSPIASERCFFKPKSTEAFVISTQNMFSWRNQKNNMSGPPLIWNYYELSLRCIFNPCPAELGYTLPLQTV